MSRKNITLTNAELGEAVVAYARKKYDLPDFIMGAIIVDPAEDGCVIFWEEVTEEDFEEEEDDGEVQDNYFEDYINEMTANVGLVNKLSETMREIKALKKHYDDLFDDHWELLAKYMELKSEKAQG